MSEFLSEFAQHYTICLGSSDCFCSIFSDDAFDCISCLKKNDDFVGEIFDSFLTFCQFGRMRSYGLC